MFSEFILGTGNFVDCGDSKGNRTTQCLLSSWRRDGGRVGGKQSLGGCIERKIEKRSPEKRGCCISWGKKGRVLRRWCLGTEQTRQINELKTERTEEKSTFRQGWGRLTHSLANSAEKQAGH